MLVFQHSYKPHSWEEFEASKAVFDSCSTQTKNYLLTQCWWWNSALSVSPEAFDTPESTIVTRPGGERSFSPAMAFIFGAHASRWKKYVRLINGVPTEFRELTLEEDACFGPILQSQLPFPLWKTWPGEGNQRELLFWQWTPKAPTLWQPSLSPSSLWPVEKLCQLFIKSAWTGLLTQLLCSHLTTSTIPSSASLHGSRAR